MKPTNLKCSETRIARIDAMETTFVRKMEEKILRYKRDNKTAARIKLIQDKIVKAQLRRFGMCAERQKEEPRRGLRTKVKGKRKEKLDAGYYGRK